MRFEKEKFNLFVKKLISNILEENSNMNQHLTLLTIQFSILIFTIMVICAIPAPDSELKQTFATWKEKHQKTYQSVSHETQR